MKKKPVILGGGESGTGAALLAQQSGMDVFLSDSNELQARYRSELVANNIVFEEGGHTVSQIEKADLIIKSPGIPADLPLLKKVRHGVEVIDEIEFAFRLLKGKVIGITGTNGKTTTTLLTYHLLKTGGIKAALAGNVGESLARKVAVAKADWYVVELSSFQLDNCHTFRPDIGILLNITPDHLDRYQYKMENYVNSKWRLTQSMKPGDLLIAWQDDVSIGSRMDKVVPALWPVSLKNNSVKIHSEEENMIFDLEEKFTIAQSETVLKGPHNRLNMMCAVAAAYKAGCTIDHIREGLKTFVNAPHRMEVAGSIRGMSFVNDSKATNVDAVVYALASFKTPLVWIAGGVDKGNEYSLIKEEVKKKVRVLICLGKDNSKLLAAFDQAVPVVLEAGSMEAAVELAIRHGKEGDTVLLSPACASFDLFKNYEDRGTQFRNAVREAMKKKV